MSPGLTPTIQSSRAFLSAQRSMSCSEAKMRTGLPVVPEVLCISLMSPTAPVTIFVG